MIASGAVPALLPAHTGVSQTSPNHQSVGTLPTPWPGRPLQTITQC
jgi:hypothetical protein